MIKDKATEEFLSALNEADEILAKMSFEKDDIIEQGPAYFVYYKRKNNRVEFLFGPPEFQVEMIIYIYQIPNLLLKIYCSSPILLNGLNAIDINKEIAEILRMKYYGLLNY